MVASLLSAVAAVAPVGGLPAAASAQAPRELLVAVLDRSGTPVLDLAPSDFLIVQDGAELDVLSAEVDLTDAASPMKVALLVDDAMPGRLLTPLRAGLNAFLEALPPLHEVSLVTIGGDLGPMVQRRTGFTADRDALREAVGFVFPTRPGGSGGVALASGIRDAWERFEDDDPFPVFVVVLRDTAERSEGFRRRNAYLDLAKELAGRGVQFHAVLFSGRGGRAGDLAHILAEYLGGVSEMVLVPTGLAAALERVAARLVAYHDRVSMRYRVTYLPGASEDGPPSIRAKRLGVELHLLADRRAVP